MAKTKQQKKDIVAELTQKIEESHALYVIAPENINPNEAAELKIKLHEIGGEYHVVKNSLFKIALEKAKRPELESIAEGRNAIVLVGENSAEAAKIMKEFIEDTKKGKFEDGLLDGDQISAEQIDNLAELPPRDQLIAQVVSAMNAPVSGLVNVLSGNVRNIINVIDAYKREKESNA